MFHSSLHSWSMLDPKKCLPRRLQAAKGMEAFAPGMEGWSPGKSQISYWNCWDSLVIHRDLICFNQQNKWDMLMGNDHLQSFYIAMEMAHWVR